MSQLARTLPTAELGGLSHTVCARVSYMSPTHSHEHIRTRTQCILKIPRYSRNDEPSEGGAKLCMYTYIYSNVHVHRHILGANKSRHKCQG